MKTLTIFALVTLLLVPDPANASIREHKRFKPAEAGEIARHLIEILKEETGPAWGIHGRRIVTEGTDLGVSMRILKGGQIKLDFNVAEQSSKEGYISETEDGVGERRTIAFKQIQKPVVSWHLSPKAEDALEKRLDSSRVNPSYEVRNTILYDEKTEKILRSSSVVTAEVWTVEAAVDLIKIYYSGHPENTKLWEDD